MIQFKRFVIYRIGRYEEVWEYVAQFIPFSSTCKFIINGNIKIRKLFPGAHEFRDLNWPVTILLTLSSTRYDHFRAELFWILL